jgi:signal transduction histidine kinase
MHRTNVDVITDICQAWLAGDWKDIPLAEGAPAEETRLAEVLAQIRRRLMTASDLKAEWDSHTDELKDRLRNAEVLIEAAKILTSTLDLEPLLKTIIDSAGKIFELSDAGIVFLYNQESDELEFVSSFGYPLPSEKFRLKPGAAGGPGWVVLNRKPLLVSGAENIATYYAMFAGENKLFVQRYLQTRGLPSQSFLCVPFISRDRVVGSLQLEHWTDSRTFTQTDLNLLTQLADLIAIAVDNGMLWSELRVKEDRLRQMVGQLISSQEAERKRLARELHDDAGQALTTALVSLTGLAHEVPADLVDLRRKIDGIKSSLKDLLNRMKDLTFEIRPSILDDLGLSAALKWYSNRFASSPGLKIDLDLVEIGKNLDSNVATVLFRVAQEAINNAIRHSHATEISIGLRQTSKYLVLIIKDNGVGFRYDRIIRKPMESFGLQGMMERLAVVNGDLKVQSVVNQGTRIKARVPCVPNLNEDKPCL